MRRKRKQILPIWVVFIELTNASSMQKEVLAVPFAPQATRASEAIFSFLGGGGGPFRITLADFCPQRCISSSDVASQIMMCTIPALIQTARTVLLSLSLAVDPKHCVMKPMCLTEWPRPPKPALRKNDYAFCLPHELPGSSKPCNKFMCH
jgi:hypothetical protein